MLRAVPSTIRHAASRLAAFRSAIFFWAIASTCCRVTLPTFSLFGTPEPLAIPAACFNREAAGGLLVMNSNVRSL